jgi:putative membrane protein
MTTASSARSVSFRDNRFLHILCGIFVAAFTLSAIHPVMREDWWLEQGLVFLSIGVLIATYRRLTFSEFSYLLFCIFLCMHEFGAHYRYALDPLGEWMKQFQSTTRNQYDRIVHCAFGLLVYYPMREMLLRRSGTKPWWALWLPVAIISGCSALYEIIEAIAAAVLSPDAGDAFLALQGDPWDTQKDMFMALVGAVTAMAMTAAAVRIRELRRQDSKTEAKAGMPTLR